jgi:hypothetical protein
MRDHGNFNINHENYLAKQILLINLMTDCLVNNNQHPLLTDKQRVVKVRFSFNNLKNIGKDIKTKVSYSGHPRSLIFESGKNLAFLEKLYELYFDDQISFSFNQKPPFFDEIHNYISRKLFKIEEQYPEYRVYPNEKNEYYSRIEKFIQYLVADNSHITYKLKQALYFLQKISIEDTTCIWVGKQAYFEFELGALLQWMGINEVKDLEKIFFRIPPSIFNIDFLISEEVENPRPSMFEGLSSGEQQKIHTINTIVYHLNNLYSVHHYKSENERIKYRFVTIVLDEIELYYHPDLQRRFIHDLIETIKNYKHLVKSEFIKSINFIFSTHSPFILSDIPEQNILKLEHKLSPLTSDGKCYSVPTNDKRQTFGANIHDLLSNSFFLDKSYKGEFANEYFLRLVDDLQKLESTEIDMTSYEKFQKRIDLIAEPFIKSKLFEMLDLKFEAVVDPLNKKIARMQEEIERLKREKETKQKNSTDDQDRKK